MDTPNKIEIVTQGFHAQQVLFPSYPHEWVAEMLTEAGKLTLKTALDLLPQGYGLKDATPRNIYFEGTTPVFHAMDSIEKRHPNDATWAAFENYCRSFLYPLVAQRTLGTSLNETFTENPNGPEAKTLLQRMGPIQRFHPRYFSLVTVPAFLSRWTEKVKSEKTFQAYTSSKREAQFVLKILLRHLQTSLTRVAPNVISASQWRTYTKKVPPFSKGEMSKISNTLKEFLAENACSTVLDTRANTGELSILSAKLGKKVVALDSDAFAMSRLFQYASKEHLGILPLHVESLTDSFVKRAKGLFDIVYRVNLNHEEFERLATLTNTYAMVDHVSATDTNNAFEKAANQYFSLIKKEAISPKGRTLYFLKKR